MCKVFHIKRITDNFITVEYALGTVLTGGFKVISKVGVTNYVVSNEHVTIQFRTFAAHGGVDNFIIDAVHDKTKDRLYRAARFTNKYYALVQGFHNTLMFKWNQSMQEMKDEKEDGAAPRECDECGQGMWAGYVIDGGLAYYCTKDCLNLHYTDEEFQEMYADGEGDSYWTEWEDGE